MQIHGNKNIFKIMKSLFVLLSLLSVLNAASVEATLSSNEIVQGNMAQLKIKAIGDKVLFPNINEVDGHQVLGRHESQQNSITYINGEVENIRAVTLVLTFAPQRDMTIPSYDIEIDGKVYKTKELKLKVVKATAPNANGNEPFSLQLRSDNKSVMVGEPFLVTVYFSLQNGTRLSENPQYNPPQFKEFFSKQVGDAKTYSEGNRQVTEIKYILTPKSEGNFTVGPATAKIGVADRTRRDMFGRFFGTKWSAIASNTINIKVKANEHNSDLVGSFTLEQNIDRQKVKANKPINLSIKITGEGSLEDLDWPNYEIDNVTVYGDDAKVSTDIIDGKIVSTYTKTFAFISDDDFTIPLKSISVYDTKEKKIKQLEIPSYDIKIDSAKKVSNSTAAAPSEMKKPKVEDGKVQTNIKVPEKSMLDGEKRVEKPKETQWLILILAFISGMFVMYMLKYLPKISFRRKNATVSQEKALKILYAHINESKEIEEMVRKLYAKKNGDKNIKIDKKVLNDLVAKVEKKN
ncbi:BatD [hydrothermal vent metagenome]|uniref:BatD n=1 Tax=hydrothermal vent metagenome TaxID=652676 RepID=A0A1W1EE97_9ZZZZ